MIHSTDVAVIDPIVRELQSSKSGYNIVIPTYGDFRYLLNVSAEKAIAALFDMPWLVNPDVQGHVRRYHHYQLLIDSVTRQIHVGVSTGDIRMVTVLETTPEGVVTAVTTDMQPPYPVMIQTPEPMMSTDSDKQYVMRSLDGKRTVRVQLKEEEPMSIPLTSSQIDIQEQREDKLLEVKTEYLKILVETLNIHWVNQQVRFSYDADGYVFYTDLRTNNCIAVDIRTPTELNDDGDMWVHVITSSDYVVEQPLESNVAMGIQLLSAYMAYNQLMLANAYANIS